MEKEYLDTSSFETELEEACFWTELEEDILDGENGVGWRVEVEVEIEEGV